MFTRTLTCGPFSLTRLAIPALICLLLLLTGCKAESQRKAPPKDTNPRVTAETMYLPYMTPALAGLVREQSWFAEMTPLQLEIVAAAQRCERAAQARGESGSVIEVLRFATEQEWYSDGLDERESKILRAVFDAYTKSFTDDNAPPIGPRLASTLRSEYFETITLKETGEMVVLVASEREDLGRRAVATAVEFVPQIEEIVGRFPYSFLYMEVTKDLPKEIAGTSYNEFIELRTDYVDKETIVHEITHSTMYGIFPTWFEEGLAHFVEYYLTVGLEAGAREYNANLRLIGTDPRIDLQTNPGDSLRHYLAERANGFLLLKGIYDIQGMEEFGKTIRSLRMRTVADQELLRAIVQRGSPETQQQLRELICRTVVNTTTNYCVR